MGEPRPLIETEAGDPLAKLVRHAAGLRVEYDVAAGVARHEQRVASLPASAAELTHAGPASSAWSGWSLVSVVAVAAVAAAFVAASEPAEVERSSTAEVSASDRFVPTGRHASVGDGVLRAADRGDDASQPPTPTVEAPASPEQAAFVDDGSQLPPTPARPRSAARPKPSASERAPSATPEKGAEDDRDDRIEREAAQIRTIRAALARHDAQAALALCDAGDDEHPDGVFAAERQGLRVLALVELGRLDDARPLAARYLEANPSGSLAPRIRRDVPGAGAGR